MHSMHHANFQRLFWICLALTIPTLVAGTAVQTIRLTFGEPTRSGTVSLPQQWNISRRIEASANSRN